MKDSNEWVRQSAVDKAAKEVLAARGCSVAELKPYWVAKKLGVDPNGEIYDKVYNFQRRMEAENTASAVEVPVAAETALRNALEHFNAEVRAIFVHAVRTAGGTIDHAAGLRVADAELRASRATSDRVDVLTLCRKAEADRDAARERIGELELELADANRREERLIGRIEQREIDAVSNRGSVEGAAEPESEPLTNVQAMVRALVNGMPDDDEATDVADRSASRAVTSNEVVAAISAAANTEQLLAIETPRPTEWQAEMPLVTAANANPAVGGDDDQG